MSRAQATERVVADLNRDASLPFAANGTYDVVTITASIGYLTRPLEVLAEAWRVLRAGGVVIISYSNRIFPEKATAVWLAAMDEELELAHLVRRYLRAAATTAASTPASFALAIASSSISTYFQSSMPSRNASARRLVTSGLSR